MTSEGQKLRIIGLCGPKYSGKDTAGEGLLKAAHTPNVFRASKMAEGVKNIVTEVFGWGPELYEHPILKETKLEEWPYIEPRWPLMDIANWMRDKYGGDVWARRWERLARQAPQYGAHIITDLRFPEEVEMMARHDSCIIYINRPEAEENLAGAQQKGNAMALNPSEAHYAFLRERADYIVDNTDSVEHLHRQVICCVRIHFDHWKYWGVQ